MNDLDIKKTFVIIENKGYEAETFCFYERAFDFFVEEKKLYLRWLDIIDDEGKNINVWGLVENVENGKDMFDLDYDNFIKLNLTLYYSEESKDSNDNLEKYNKKYDFN